MKRYEVIMNHTEYDGDAIMERLNGMGYTEEKIAKIKFVESVFHYGEVNNMTVWEAIECLAMKDGADFVRFEDGNYGFMAEYNGKENGFEIMEDGYKWTLKEFRENNTDRHVFYTCEFQDCDYETATEADTRILESWEESGAIVTDEYEIDGTHYVDCMIEMQDD